MNSVDYTQLNGEKIDKERAKDQCKKRVTNKDAGMTTSVGQNSLSEDDVLAPCGLHATLIPKETFELKDSSGTKISISNENIVMDGIKGVKYKNSQDFKTFQWADMENGNYFNFLCFFFF